jgi:hypothetical protein
MTDHDSKGNTDGLPQGSDPESPIEPGPEGTDAEGVDGRTSESGGEEDAFASEPGLEIQTEALNLLPSESSPDVKLALIELADKEGQRSLKAAEAALAADFQRFKLKTETTEKSANEDRGTLRRASLIDFAKWAAPATFAIVLAWWMVQFFRAGNIEAAKSIRELLLLMIGGALGWIARRSGE